MKRPKRICIFPKDIQLITGRSSRYGCKVIKEIKTKLGKEPHQFVTIHEFAEYSGLEIELIEKFIID